MFTPQEVSEKSFPKASFGGYNMAAVDEFLDALTEDYSALYKDNATLKAKLKVLAEKVEEYRATEEAMRSTLLTAQRMAAQMVQDAQAEKDKVLTEAHEAAAKQMGSIQQETEMVHKKLAVAQEELAAFVQRSRELCAAQIAFLEQLPEMEMAAAKQPAASAMTQDTVRIEGQDVLRNLAAKEEPSVEAAPVAEAPAAEKPVVEEPVVETVPEEKPAAEEAPAPAAEEPVSVKEEPAAPAEEERPFPTDFHLNLDELKFGRNYSGD